jgi:hypothetical protein
LGGYARGYLRRWQATQQASAVSAQLDPAYRMEGLPMAWFRRAVLIPVAVAVPIALIALYIQVATWKDGHWHIGWAA